jgi:transaldolase
MTLFIDTANLDEIKEIAEWGVVRGVTTNPKLFSVEGVSFKERVHSILSVIPGPLSVEVTTNDFGDMIREARNFATWSDHIVVKVPIGPAGLRAVKILSSEGIKTNVTAIMTVGQAMLAGAAGATYASIFYSRIEDVGADGLGTIQQSVALYKHAAFSTQIIVGSIRLQTQICNAAASGAHVITVPYKFFKQLASHPQSDRTIDEFLNAWQGSKVLA